MWAIAIYDFKLTSDQFWHLTPGQYSAIAEIYDSRYDQAQRHLDLLAGIIASTMANCHRGSDTPAFEPKQFMPRYPDDTTDEEAAEKKAASMHQLWQSLIVPAQNSKAH